MHHNGCNYLSMLGLKLNHVSKRGHRDTKLWYFICCPTDNVAEETLYLSLSWSATTLTWCNYDVKWCHPWQRQYVYWYMETSKYIGYNVVCHGTVSISNDQTMRSGTRLHHTCIDVRNYQLVYLGGRTNGAHHFMPHIHGFAYPMSFMLLFIFHCQVNLGSK